MSAKILVALICLILLLFGCATIPTQSDTNKNQTDTTQDDTIQDDIGEIIDTINDELPKPSNIGSTGLSYKFDTPECTATSSRNSCLACDANNDKKMTQVYVDYTNKAETNKGYFIKIIYGPDNNVVIGEPQGFSVGQTRRLIATTDPLTNTGCLSEVTAEVYAYVTKELLETAKVTSSD